jgi:hypothetical protein
MDSIFMEIDLYRAQTCFAGHLRGAVLIWASVQLDSRAFFELQKLIDCIIYLNRGCAVLSSATPPDPSNE